MRVLQLGKFYDPFVGGMETVLKEICESLADDIQFQVVVANTSFRTTHEKRKISVTRVASMGKLFSCSLAPSIHTGRESLIPISFTFIFPIL